ncbi:Uncharacterized protein QTN25_001016 [Entamoeba marina]
MAKTLRAKQRSERLSLIPTLSLSVTEQTVDRKKLARLSFSDEFHEHVNEIEIDIDLYTGKRVTFKTTTGETIQNIIKYCEEKHDVPKGTVAMVYKENLLLPCLSLADVPDLAQDSHPVITAVKDE